MRDIGGLATKITKRTMSMACCWRIETDNGRTLGFTSCSHDLEVGGLTYHAAAGIEATAIQFSTGLSVSNAEISGFLNDNVLPALHIRAGVFDNAQVYQFVVDYDDPDDGSLKLLWGTLGEITRKGPLFTAEIRGGEQLLAVPIVSQTQATCRNAYGDAACKKVPGTNTATITSITNSKQFVSSGLASARADGFFNYGYLTWLTGDNAGLRMDVRQYTSSTGTVLMSVGAVIPMHVGDQFTIREGCLKTKSACKSKDNIENLNAEPEIPGNDELLKVIRAS